MRAASKLDKIKIQKTLAAKQQKRTLTPNRKVESVPRTPNEVLE
jgi:hypothetical protein